MQNKPGIMLYFDMRHLLANLSYRDKGMLLDAMLAYGEEGTPTELSARCSLLWPVIRMRLDNDTTRYRKTVVKRKYAAYTRWAKAHDQKPMAYEEWMEKHGFSLYEDDELDFKAMQAMAADANASDAMQTMPTTDYNFNDQFQQQWQHQ